MRRSVRVYAALGLALLLPLPLPGTASAAEAPAARASLSDGERQHAGYLARSSASSDGRFVVMLLARPQWRSGEAGGLRVYLRDRLLGTTRQIDTEPPGRPVDGDAEVARVSDDGRLVVFVTTATGLLPSGDEPHTPDAFLHDTRTGTTRHLPLPGVAGDQHPLWDVTLSGNGRYLGYERKHVYRHDLLTGRTMTVDVDQQGRPGNRWASDLSLSADGDVMAFSSSSNLLPGDTARSDECSDESSGPGCNPDVFVRDLRAGTTRRVTATPDDRRGTSWGVSVSRDGSTVVFRSSVRGLDPAAPQARDWHVYAHDLRSRRTVLVDRTSSGGIDVGEVFDALSVSSDGRRIAWTSPQEELDPRDRATGWDLDVFVRDLDARTTTMVVGQGGAHHNGTTIAGDITGDGRSIVLFTDAANLVRHDTNGRADVFVQPLPG